MNSQLLTEKAWKGVAQKTTVKDNGLQQALSAYEKLAADRHDERLKQIGVVVTRATALKAGADPTLAKYLTGVLAAAETARRDITRAKSAPEPEAEPEPAVAEKSEEDADEKNVQADGKVKAKQDAEMARLKIGKPLLAGLQLVQRGNGKAMQWIATVKDAKSRTPAAGLLIAASVGPTQQQLLTQVTGSSRFLRGTCSMEQGKLTFVMKGASSSLQAQIRESIQYFAKTSVQVNVRGPMDVKSSVVNPSAAVTGTASPRVVEEVANESVDEGSTDEAQPKAERAPASAKPAGISASVGRGGKNLVEDVKFVQAALNRRNNAGLGAPDGKCGAKTIQAIENFQKALGFSKPDGIVEPNRGTARALVGSGKITPVPARAKTMAPPKLGKPVLATAHHVWHGTRGILENNIKALKGAIKQEYANEHPEVMKAIDGNVAKLDVILEKLDKRLSDALEKANAAKDEEARKVALKDARGVLAGYIEYVKQEPLIDHIDKNPFNVDTKLEKVITDSLTHMAMSIGA